MARNDVTSNDGVELNFKHEMLTKEYLDQALEDFLVKLDSVVEGRMSPEKAFNIERRRKSV